MALHFSALRMGYVYACGQKANPAHILQPDVGCGGAARRGFWGRSPAWALGVQPSRSREELMLRKLNKPWYGSNSETSRQQQVPEGFARGKPQKKIERSIKMSKPITLKRETLLDMAELIHFPVAPEREEVLRVTAESWYNSANALVEKMMDLEHWEVIPVGIIRVKD